MRGLTPAERQELIELCGNGPPEETRDDGEEALLNSLVQQRRAVVTPCAESPLGWAWEPTALGELALKLWPATAATPGAGGR
jgi:hypothetical protein